MSKEYIVEVFELSTGRVIEAIKCDSESKAEKVLRGLLRQINADVYGAAMKPGSNHG